MDEKRALDLHRRLRGKFSIAPKINVTKKNLALLYTPGVASASKAIAKSNEAAYDLTIKANSVAIVTDGSSLLGMGNLGAQAALPVMEGKAILFKKFAGINAFPICIDTQDSNKIIEIVRNISSSFGGINLEDISAPKCFEIEKTLQNIGIPVFHDDQHGTAIVVYAALQNAAKAVKKKFSELHVVISGAGAAGSAISKLLAGASSAQYDAVEDVIVADTQGAIYKGRPGLAAHKQEIARFTNKKQVGGSLAEVIRGSDAFVGVSRPGVLKPEMIKSMGKDPIVFAIANPVPEIMPADAKKAGAKVIATGRSDFPNQVNNALAFPGVFRGALDARVKKITTAMQVNAAIALARIIKNPTPKKIIPCIFDKRIVNNIAHAIKITRD